VAVQIELAGVDRQQIDAVARRADPQHSRSIFQQRPRFVAAETFCKIGIMPVLCKLSRRGKLHAVQSAA
jgi:hypothetical protein